MIEYYLIKYDSATNSEQIVDVEKAPRKYNVNLLDALVVEIPAFYDLKIDSIENIIGNPTITIKDDGVVYNLGDTIAKGSVIEVSSDINCAIILHVSIP